MPNRFPGPQAVLVKQRSPAPAGLLLCTERTRLDGRREASPATLASDSGLLRLLQRDLDPVVPSLLTSATARPQPTSRSTSHSELARTHTLEDVHAFRVGPPVRNQVPVSAQLNDRAGHGLAIAINDRDRKASGPPGAAIALPGNAKMAPTSTMTNDTIAERRFVIQIPFIL